MSRKRLNAIRSLLPKFRLHALLVTEMANVRYLTGFSGSNGLCLITPAKQIFITDRRYTIQARQEVKGFNIKIAKQDLFPILTDSKLIVPQARIGFDSKNISVDEFKKLRKLLKDRKFVPVPDIMETVTAIKDKKELELIGNAVKITDKVFMKILEVLRPGVSEFDISAEISYWHRKYGAECDAFDPIVASGERSALPHARASGKIIKNGEVVVLDFGCKYQGYHSDMTRTVAIGNLSAKMKKVYQIVLDAQLRAIDLIKNGIAARSVDAAARNYIKQKGFGQFFIHSLGHGLGIQIHEPLRLSILSRTILKTNNVVTVEPGIYIPGVGGVRIEDDVVVKDHGCSILTKSAKELIIV